MYKRITACLLLMWIALASRAHAATPLPTPSAHLAMPIQTVQAFYEAIKRGDCPRAIELKPSYELQQCRATHNVDLRALKVEQQDEQQATVHVHVRYHIQDQQGIHKQHFIGRFLLQKRLGRWIIQGDTITQAGRGRETVAPLEEGRPAGPQAFSPPLPPPKLSRGERWALDPQWLLRTLWPATQLQGRADEKIIRPQTAPVPPPQSNGLLDWMLAPRLEPPASIRRIDFPPTHKDKPIALTFDLCERADDQTGYDGAIIDSLRHAQVPATFFAGGKWMKTHADRAMQLLADPLFEVGNHSWTHDNLRRVTGERLEQQILWPQVQYAMLRAELLRQVQQRGFDAQALTHVQSVPRVFRFPYGTCNAAALRAVANAGLLAIQWDVVSGDPAPSQTASQIEATVLRTIKPGSIVVFHANGRGHGTAAALPHLVHTLRAQGFTFVTVSDLLQQAQQYGGRLSTAQDCYEQRPGDNQHYDRLVGHASHE